MRIPKALEKMIESFERLPGIGPKSAQRLAFYLLHVPQEELDSFAENLTNLKTKTTMCEICFNIGDTKVCSVCADPQRDQSIVCIVEDALDVLALEKSGKYGGIYHVLHGVIDPLNSIGPDDIYIPQLMNRLRDGNGIGELILATNPTLEGEATSMYIARAVGKLDHPIRITRIGRGLPTGADLEYADELTIQRALEGRREY